MMTKMMMFMMWEMILFLHTCWLLAFNGHKLYIYVYPCILQHVRKMIMNCYEYFNELECCCTSTNAYYIVTNYDHQSKPFCTNTHTQTYKPIDKLQHLKSDEELHSKKEWIVKTQTQNWSVVGRNLFYIPFINVY